MYEINEFDEISIASNDVGHYIYDWYKSLNETINYDRLPFTKSITYILGEAEVIQISAENRVFIAITFQTRKATIVVNIETGKKVLDTNNTTLSDKEANGVLIAWEALMHYIVLSGLDAETIEHEQVKAKISKKQKKNNSRKSKKIIIKNRYKIKSFATKKVVNWKKESWGVRGHYRKLKSGKVIFIKEHIKGTGKKGKKEYLIDV